MSREFQNPFERRFFLRTLAAGSTLALPGWTFGKNSLWLPEELPLTPTQTEGPFYPQPTIEQQLHNDSDLTRKLADHERAKGQVFVISGVVKNQSGSPLPGAIVEAWQACASGRYHHQRDQNNKRLLDNNFQFWGRVIADDQGRYAFKSIIPGKYPGRTARHIHFRVDGSGYLRLSTQCYFDEYGEDNARDGIYRSLTAKERRLVTVEVNKPGRPDNKLPWTGKFDMVLAKG